MKQDYSGKIAIHKKKSLISIDYTNLQFCRFIISKINFFTPTLKGKVQNRSAGKAKIAGFLTLRVLAPLLFTPALVKHTRVGGNWVKGMLLVSCADNFCKQIGLRSGPTKRRA